MPRRTRTRWLAMLAVLAFLLAACGQSDGTTAPDGAAGSTEDDGNNDEGGEDAASGESIELILATGAPTHLAVGEGQAFFAETVEEMTDGQVTVQVHLDGSLYNERTSLEAIQSGAIDIGGASNANFGAFTDALFWMDMPLLIDSSENLTEIMQSDFGQESLDQVERDGFKILASLANGGFRSMVNTRREVVAPDDLDGLKMRTTASPVEIAMFEVWGANPTAVDWGETYDALNQGVVDGEFVMWTWLDAANHCEVLDYGTNGPFAIGLQFIAMNPDRFAELPSDIQDVLVDAGKQTEEFVQEADDAAVEAARESCENENGVQMTDLTDEEVQPWRESVQEIWGQFSEQVPEETIQRILDLQS